MLKKTETGEMIVFFVTFLSLVAFQFGGRAGPLGPSPWLRLCSLYWQTLFKLEKQRHFEIRQRL